VDFLPFPASLIELFRLFLMILLNLSVVSAFVGAGGDISFLFDLELDDSGGEDEGYADRGGKIFWRRG